MIYVRVGDVLTTTTTTTVFVEETTTTTTTTVFGEETTTTTTTVEPSTTTTTTTAYDGGGVKTYPYTFEDLRQDYPWISFSPNGDFRYLNVYPVTVPPKPSDNTKNYTEELVYIPENQTFLVNWVGVDKTPEELTVMKKNELARNKQIDTQALLVQSLMQESQVATTLDKIASYKNLYPLWEDQPDGFQFSLEYKVNYIDSNINLRLFRCIQAHAKQASWNPVAVPALWSEIILSAGGIEVWTQPIGGDGKYPYIDPLTGLPYKVLYNGFTWENNYQAGLNVWVPGEFGWTQL